MSEKIDSYRQTMAALHQELKETEARRSAILKAIDAIDGVLAARSAGQFDLLTPATHNGQGGGRRKHGAVLQPAMDVLREAGRPLHIDKIVTAMRARGVGNDSRSFRYSVSRSLDRKADKKGSPVTKPAPATYEFCEEEVMEQT